MASIEVLELERGILELGLGLVQCLQNERKKNYDAQKFTHLSKMFSIFPFRIVFTMELVSWFVIMVSISLQQM